MSSVPWWSGPPTRSGARTAALSIADSAPNSPHQVSLLGGVAAPQLRLEPAVGPPGIVATVIGTGFPPGANPNNENQQAGQCAAGCFGRLVVLC